MPDFFIIKELPSDRSNILFDGFPVVLGQKYPMEDEDKITIENATAFKGIPFDSFKFQIETDGILSQNIATCTINFNTSDAIPDAIDLIEDIIMTDIVVFSDIVPQNEGFDRILFSSILGKGSWELESSQLQEDNVIFYYELFEKLKFYPSDLGAEDNYAELKFYFQDNNGNIGPENSIKINTSSLAELSSGMEILSSGNNPEYVKEFSFSIEKQIVGKDFEIEFETEISSLEADPLNKVTIEADGFLEEVDTNDVFLFPGNNPNENGIITFTVRTHLQSNFVSGDFIKIKLLSIDSNPLLVNTAKNELTFNL